MLEQGAVKTPGSGLCGALLALSLMASVSADDTDIYRHGGGATAAVSRIMLALDFSEGAAAAVCEDVASVYCRRFLGEQLLGELDLYGLVDDTAGALKVARGADGLADQRQADPSAAAGSIAERHWPGSQVRQYDTLRAVIRVAVLEAAAGIDASSSGAAIQVGLMLPHAQDCDGAGPLFLPDYSGDFPVSCSRGAYVLRGFSDITDTAKRQSLFVGLAAIPEPGLTAPWMKGPWAGHPYPLRDIYFELFRYISGQQVFNGFLGSGDYGSRMAGNLYHDNRGRIRNDVLLVSPEGAVNQPLLGPDTNIMLPASLDLRSDSLSRARYASPLGPAEECARFYMVNVMFGTSAASHADTNAALVAPYHSGGLQLFSLPAGEAGDAAVVGALYKEDIGSGRFSGMPDIAGRQNVVSYFLAAEPDATMTALALAGGSPGVVSLRDPRQVLRALKAVFNRVIEVSASFTAGSVAASASDRSRAGSDVYFALFQPGSEPLWHGNVKKLKIVETEVVDPVSATASGRQLIVQAPLTHPPVPALSPEDGSILPDALTFWTDPDGEDVLAFDPARDEVAGADGRSAHRGGAGQQVPGYLTDTVGAGNAEPDARQLFTQDPDIPGAMLALDATGPALSRLSRYLDPPDALAPEQERSLLRWIRGQDAFDKDGDGDLLESRAWLMGDPLHSRPLAVNFGARPGTSYTTDNPDIRLYFGTNDGIFHAVINTREGASGEESGVESWAFIPLELLAMQSDLARGSSIPAHPYGMDGEAVAFIADRDGDGSIEIAEGEAVWVYIGQRRGGSGLYAFDMSDPDAPGLKWVISRATPGFEQLGMTFSTPRAVELDLGGDSLTPVLVFAGGYNGGWKGGSRWGKDAGRSRDLIGNAIYVVNADDGSLIWRAAGPSGAPARAGSDGLHLVPGMIHSIPSPVTVVDADSNGVVDRAYVGDSGGNVWRVELREHARKAADTSVTDASNWYVTRLASLGGHAANDRRFFHAPDYVRTRDSGGDYDALLITSGNRAAPLETAVQNFAYLLKDRVDPTDEEDTGESVSRVITHDVLVDMTDVCTAASDTACATPDLTDGWKLALESPGEKGLSQPLVSNGTALFTTFSPGGDDATDHCAPSQGTGRVYAVRLGNAAARFTPPGSVEMSTREHRYRDVGPGIPAPVVPLGDKVLIPGKGIDGRQIYSIPGASRWRVYWRQDVDPF